MRKLFLIFINIVVIISVATFMYHSYQKELNSQLEVACEYNYLVNSNTISLSCEVEDIDLIISDESPLNIYIFDINDIIVFESSLSAGINELSFNELEYNSQYNIQVKGYDYINEDYVPTQYSEFAFSTTRSDIVIPTYVFTENLVTDTEYQFSFELDDVANHTESIDISLYDNNNNLLVTQNFTEFSDLDFSFTDLDSTIQYIIIVDINYIINDFNALSKLTAEISFTTIEPQISPSAVISDVYNNNENLSFSLSTNNQDATDVTFIIELIDLQENVMYSEVMTDSEFMVDVSSISGNYYISVKVSYLLNGDSYSDIELVAYSIYSNELSNFFSIPTVDIINTDLPLTSYDDYSDYVFTFLNEGVSEFSITCEAPVDCTQLVTNDLYSEIPFIITDLVHAYNDINSINYSYTSTHLNIIVGKEYEIEDINLIDQEINLILNSIINESMTDYEKILSVHDYIINNTSYDSDCYDDVDICDNDHTAIGVLFDNFAVCEGYAHTMDIMLRSLKIPTFRLSSNTHQWSAVYYNGGWHHLDATWDDPVTTNGSDVLVHTFFLITSDELISEDSSSSHDFETRFVNFME